MKLKRGILIVVLALSVLMVLNCVPETAIAEYHIPSALGIVLGMDGSVWEQVCIPGFGDEENFSVIGMAEYQGRLYVMTRNDVKGAEVWRTAGTSWEQVLFPGGETNGVYGNTWMNNHMGAMIVFQDKLYFGFSSGVQGNYLRSSGGEIWRYDGMTWEPVISDRKDTEEAGTITEIKGCGTNDGDLTAQITDSSKSWTLDQWAGGVLQITSGEGKFRRFDIKGNTADTLTVQQNEIAGEQGTEYTICDKKHYKNPFPPYEYDLGKVQVGDTYEIGTGYDENGFGDYWNKTLPKMTVFEKRLYVSTCLNYDYGGQVWYTEDGDNWTVTQPPRSLGLFHTDPNYPDSKKPVSRGIPGLGSCNVSGSDVLYAGSLGSDGNLGACARFAKLTEDGWELIVDSSVDDNDTGTNENGFGGGMSCTMYNGNFNVWSISCFKNVLYVGFQSMGGARVLYSLNGSSEDGSWFYSVGGDSGMPNGFDGVINEGVSANVGETVYQNIAVNLFPFEDYLYAGLICQYLPEFGATEEYLTGSQIWKTADGTTWQEVTNDGFGDVNVLTFEAFEPFNGMLYVSASKAANTVGTGLGGAKLFRLVPEASVAITKAQIKYNLEKVNKDEIVIKGEFTPATPIDPSNEIVALTIVTTTAGSIFSDTISPGCFVKKEKGEKWSYKRKKQGCETRIDMMTIDLGKSTFEIKAEGENLTRLPATLSDTLDVTIDIRVGNDRGVATNPFRVKKDKKTGIPVKLEFKAGDGQ